MSARGGWRILFAALLLAAPVEATRSRQRPPPRRPRPAQPAPGPLCRVDGAWRGTGMDEAGTRWDYTLTLTQTGTALLGAFQWAASNGHHGREDVRGSVDCVTHRFRLDGYRLVNASSELITGDYHGVFDDAFQTFTGSWSNGIPGTFRGSR